MPSTIIPSSFPLISSHSPSHPLPPCAMSFLRHRFLHRPPSSSISSFLLPISSTNKAIRAFRSRSHEPGDKFSPEPLKSALIASYVTFYPLNTIQTPVKCHMNVI